MTDLAHPVWEAVAVMLAQPLRDAFNGHMDNHGCGCCGPRWCKSTHTDEGHAIHGFAHCPEAMHLFNLLPEGDTVIIA